MVKRATKPKPLTVGDQLAKWDRLIYGYAMRIGRKHGLDPDDVFGDLILALIRKHETDDPQRSYGTFIGLIARSVSGRLRDQRRREIRTVQVEDNSTEGCRHGDRHVCMSQLAADYRTPDPSDAAEVNERRDLVRKAIATLPRDQRRVVLAHVHEGKPVRRAKGEVKLFREALVALSQHLGHI
ncbi:MAG: sigma-70 family RNA polymerase sigma factor [Planctomycetes bacterium]|nr:sigma-70 family RNA polymerase sigma factor [Planctomycetota bacterium]